MNIVRKPVKVVQCRRCTDVYELVGSTPIGLSKPVKPDTNSETGLPYSGVCPKHPRPLEVKEMELV